MGPKRRLSVAERPQRANAITTTAKKRPATGSDTQSPASRRQATKLAANPSTSAGSPSKKDSGKTVASPAKKLSAIGKNELTAAEQHTKKSTKVNEDKSKEKSDEKKASTSTSSRENVKKTPNEVNDSSAKQVKDDLKNAKKEDNGKEDNLSFSSNTSSCDTKSQSKNDGKHKAISKMLKNLDIKISGFDNLLPKEQSIQELGMKSSISENVKTKSRAAAVKVIASLCTPKPIKRPKVNEDEKRKVHSKPTDNPELIKETANEKNQGAAVTNKIIEDKIEKQEDMVVKLSVQKERSEKSCAKEKSDERPVEVMETKKKIAAKKARIECNQKDTKVQASKIQPEKQKESHSEDIMKEEKLKTEEALKSKKVAVETSELSSNKPKPKEKESNDQVKVEPQIRPEDQVKGSPCSNETHTKRKSSKCKNTTAVEKVDLNESNQDVSVEDELQQKDTENSVTKTVYETLIPSKPLEGIEETENLIIAPSTRMSSNSTTKSLDEEKSSELMCNKLDEMFEEKEEILKVTIDLNTELVQMEMKEIAPNKNDKKSLVSDMGKLENDGKDAKNVGGIKEKDDSSLTSLALSPKLQAATSSIKERLQPKYKVNPIKKKITKQIKKLPLVKAVTAEIKSTNKEGVTNDIYDFKSGSEDEENIKMELPTLKNLREFSVQEDNHQKKLTPKKETSKFTSIKEKSKNEGSQINPKSTEEISTRVEQCETIECNETVATPIETVATPKSTPCKESKETEEDVNKVTKESQQLESPESSEESGKEMKDSKTPPKKSVKIVKKILKTAPKIKTMSKKLIKQKTLKSVKAIKRKITKKSGKSIAKLQKTPKPSVEEISDSDDEKSLIVFSQKRHRMASLNALAKVQCLYENESRTAYELGLSKATLLPPKIRTLDGSDEEKKEDCKQKDYDKEKLKSKDSTFEEKAKNKKYKRVEDPLKLDDSPKDETGEEDPVEEPKRGIRNVTGGRGFGKHWEFDSDSELDEIDQIKVKKKKLQKKLHAKTEKELEKEKLQKEKREAKSKEPIKVKRKYTKAKKPLKKIVKLSINNSEYEGNSESTDKESHNNDTPPQKNKLNESKKLPKKRKRIFKEELIGDYKGILARKRMASLNASAIVAATYEVERHLDRNFSGYDTYEDGQKNTTKKIKESKAKDTREAKTTKPSATVTSAKSTSAISAASTAATASLSDIIIVTTAPTSSTSTTTAAFTTTTLTAAGTVSTIEPSITDSKTSAPHSPTKPEKPSNFCEESNDSKYSKDTKETNTDTTTTTSTSSSGSTTTNSTKDAKDSSRPTSSSVVIVQDTDVTITGVYVNSSSGAGQEAFCKMQYRVQSSVTEERLVRPGSTEPPPKSYTPLSALSSMLPPGATTGAAEGNSIITPPPTATASQPTSTSSLSETLNASAGPYNPADLGIHTEQGPVDLHGPPPPSYAVAAAAATAAYHTHHMSPHSGGGHHQHQYAHAHVHHQYQQAGVEHHGLPSHHYAGPGPPPPSHYGPPAGLCGDAGSPPPTYRASSGYSSNPTASATTVVVQSSTVPTSLSSGLGGSAFCPTNVPHQQPQQQLTGSQSSSNEASGYYQPAGPLISPHVIPPVSAGPPPVPPNVPLIPAANPKIKLQTQSTTTDTAHLPISAQSNPATVEGPESELLLRGGDLTPYRYPSQSGNVAAHHNQQQQHQLHQQAAAHAAAAHARSMHAQMHYSTAYPANYYSPYPGEPMCYSPPTYQPYFPTKVYQNAPPPPHHAAYRRYPYYQPGHPPPADIYEQTSPQPTVGGAAPPPSGPPPTQAGPPPGSQIVPAGPAGHGQHLEHYPGPPGYYPSYSTSGGGPAQCYTRSIQAPYMEYQPQCPCPMQQSCPKNVHTGPHIGSNNNSSSINHTHNSSSTSANLNACGNSTSNSTQMTNHYNNSLNSMTLQHHNNSSSSNNKSTSDSSTVNHNSNTNSSTRMNANNNINNVLNSNRGPVKNQATTHETRSESSNNIPLLSIAVKTELSPDDSDNKSQYEENVVTPLTPPDSYSTNEEKLGECLDNDNIANKPIPLEEDAKETTDKRQAGTTPLLATAQELLSVATPIEAYDLTTATPPLSSSTSTAPPATDRQSPQLMVGRRARIGKSMAWNMVYAGAASTTHSNIQQHNVTTQSCTVARTDAQPSSQSLHPAGLAQQRQMSNTQSHVVSNLLPTPSSPTFYANNVSTTQKIDEVPGPLLFKAEIKAEKIKLEDDIIDTMLQHQSQHVEPQSPQKHIIHEMKNDLKIIKAEPITLCEILKESKVKVESDFEMIKVSDSKDLFDAPKQASRSAGLILSKPHERISPLTLWQHPIQCAPSSPPAANCSIDICNTSDDEVLDICNSPVATSSMKSSGKRIKILEFNKSQCKKSPPNSYKSLIKQAEPKMYLCLSRKSDRKSRFGKLQSSKSIKGSGLNNGIRQRKLILTDQQKERLRLRKKKLAAMEKRRKEAKEQRKAEIKQKRKEAKAIKNIKDERLEYGKLKNEAVIVNLIEDDDSQVGKSCIPHNMVATKVEVTAQTLPKNVDRNLSPTTTKTSPKRGKHPKKPVIPLHLIETIDAVARGYFSEPECRSSSNMGSPNPIDLHKTITGKNYHRNVSSVNVEKKYKTTSEKRSKSETKKPLKAIRKTDLFNRDPLTGPVLCVDTATAQTLTTSKSAEHLNATNTEKSKSKQIEDQHKMTKSSLQKFRSKGLKIKRDKKQRKSLKSKRAKAIKIIHNQSNTVDSSSIPKDPTDIKDTQTKIHVETNNNEYSKLTTGNETPKESQVTHTGEELTIEDISRPLAGTVETNYTFNIQNKMTPTIVIEPSVTTTDINQLAASVVSQSPIELSHSDGTTLSTTPVFIQPTLPPMPRVVCHSHHHVGKRNRSRSKFGSRKRQKLKHSTVSFEVDDTIPPAMREDVVPKWNNGWTWEGEQFQGAVFLNSDDPLVIRTCYPAMRHVEGDIIRARDCVLLKANEDNELPYVAKVAHLWENPEDGEMMMSLLWYYRPEHTDQGRQSNDSPDEVYASRHRDHNSVACIEDKCYVLTFSEYCRYRRRLRAAEEDIEDVNSVPKRPNDYCIRVVPENTNPELVMFCRRAYEFRTRRLLKMPNKQDYYVVKS